TNDPVGPEIIIAGVAEFGREFFNPTAYTNNVFQFVDNTTFIRGNHTLKTGVDFNILDLSGFAEVFLGGQFTFAEAIPLASIMNSLLGPGTATGLIRQLSTPTSAEELEKPCTSPKIYCPDLVPNVLAPISSVQAFNFGLPITYFQGFGNPNTSFAYLQLGLYLQDNWKVRENFTLNLGVRYDVDWRGETQNVTSATAPFSFDFASTSDPNNIAPRIGFAWDPANNGKTVIRGGYGIYYQNYFQATGFVSQVLAGQRDGRQGISQVFLPLTGLPGFNVTSADIYGFFAQTGTLGEPALAAFGISPGTTPAAILPGDQNVVNPYSHHASFGIEQELTPDLSISVDYLLNRGVHLIRSRDTNVRQVGPNQFQLFPSPTLLALDPRFVQVNMIETSGSSIYHGFSLSLRKRFSRNYSAMLSYTLGKVIDDTTDFITPLQPNNQADLRSERSLSSFDQRNRLVISGIWQSPHRLSSSNSLLRNVFADWSVAPIVTLSSGRPFNLLVGFDLNGDTHSQTDRPVLSDGTIVGRNTGKGPSFFATDLRIARKFNFPREETNFEFIFEAFNLFNNVNYSGVNNVVGPLLTTGVVEGSKGVFANQPLGFTSAFDPRQIQFGFRLNF
ncbi:TonB-dependent receptor, partial [Acidobacteria bacterium AH-259-L09]|nr:TonB-dependent receptor [Acidobacteria bacterium AH-259-L09]